MRWCCGQIGHSQCQELDKISSANPTGEDEEWILNPLKRVTMNADKVEDVVVDKDHGREELLSATTKARMLTKVHTEDYVYILCNSWQALIISRLA